MNLMIASRQIQVISLLGLLWVTNIFALEPLSEHQMEYLTAGASMPPAFDHSYPQHISGSIDFIDTATQGTQPMHDVPQSNNMIVSADSDAALTIAQEVQLSNQSQQDVIANSMINGVASDLIHSLNISSGWIQGGQNVQNNVVNQTVNTLASVELSHWQSAYEFTKTLSQHNRHEQNNYSGEEIQMAITRQQTSQTYLYDVAIEKYDPRLFLGDIQLSTPDPGPLTLIPGLHRENTITAGSIVDALDIFDVIPNSVDYELGWGATTLELPVLSAGIDRNTVTHENLTINLTAEPPKLEIGNVYFNTQAHYDDHSDNKIHWINTQPISFAPPDVNINLDVPNPVYGFDMSVNHGFALAGNGEIKGDFGGFEGLATINFTNVLSNIFPIDEFIAAIDVGVDVINALDFLNVFPDVPKPGDLDLDLVINIPIVIDLNTFIAQPQAGSGSVSVVDEDHAYAFHIKYNGVFCFELFGDGNCGSMTEQVTSRNWVDHSYAGSFFSQNSSTDEFSDSHDHIAKTGGVIKGAVAEKIILSGSSLLSNENSAIQLDHQSQKNLMAVNVTNASSTIAANSMNVHNSRTFFGLPSAISTGQLLQSNKFIQTR